MKSGIQLLIDYWETSFYLHPLVILVAGVSLCIVSTSRQGVRYKKLLQLYFSSLLLLFGGTDVILLFQLMKGSRLNLLVEHANNIFNLIEAYVFIMILSFYSQGPNRTSQNRLLIFLHVALTLIGFFILMGAHNKSDTFRWNTFSTVIHFFIIIVPCVLYFYDVYKQNPVLSFGQVSTNLAITAYSLVSIPVFAIIEYSYISEYGDKITAIHYIFLIILCVSLCFNDVEMNDKKIFEAAGINE